MTKLIKSFGLLCAVLLFFCIKVQAQEQVPFNEIWAYLMKGEESFLKANYPITDIAYFAAEIDSFGNLSGVPVRSKINNFQGKVHLVVAQVSNRALIHFSIDPQYSVRNKLIEAIVKAVEPFDGLQIDFELIPTEDRQHFYSFLSTL